jgi:hypothetical protein
MQQTQMCIVKKRSLEGREETTRLVMRSAFEVNLVANILPLLILRGPGSRTSEQVCWPDCRHPGTISLLKREIETWFISRESFPGD